MISKFQKVQSKVTSASSGLNLFLQTPNFKFNLNKFPNQLQGYIFLFQNVRRLYSDVGQIGQLTVEELLFFIEPNNLLCHSLKLQSIELFSQIRRINRLGIIVHKQRLLPGIFANDNFCHLPADAGQDSRKSRHNTLSVCHGTL